MFQYFKLLLWELRYWQCLRIQSDISKQNCFILMPDFSILWKISSFTMAFSDCRFCAVFFVIFMCSVDLNIYSEHMDNGFVICVSEKEIIWQQRGIYSCCWLWSLCDSSDIVQEYAGLYINIHSCTSFTSKLVTMWLLLITFNLLRSVILNFVSTKLFFIWRILKVEVSCPKLILQEKLSHMQINHSTLWVFPCHQALFWFKNQDVQKLVSRIT